MVSGFWIPLFSGTQQARCARIGIPPPKTSEHSDHTSGMSPGTWSRWSQSPQWDSAPRAHHANVLGDVSSIGCLLFSVSESLCHVPTGISWEPISGRKLVLILVLGSASERTQAKTPMD